jgi:hypothetical protein
MHASAESLLLDTLWRLDALCVASPASSAQLVLLSAPECVGEESLT